MIKLFALGRWLLDAREWLILLAIAAVAAYFYVDARQVRADRDAWARWAEQTCAFAGAATAAGTVEIETDKGNRRVAKTRGQRCTEAIRDLAHFKLESAVETARILTEARNIEQRNAASDAAIASAQADKQRRAAAEMEKVDAQIGTDNRVDGNWFARLNQLGGLQPND